MTRWGKLGTTLCASLALCIASSANAELLTFKVIPAFAPNGPTAPSWQNYVINAVAGIQLDADLGDRSTNPAAYERVSGNVPPSEMIYTPYHSWRGVADPNPLDPAFANELGNRIHFGLHMVGSADWEFALADLTWELDSDDADGVFDQSGSFAAANYSSTRIGIDWGPDGIKGGVDDVIYNAGQAGTTPVNELIYVGVGEGFLSLVPEAMTDQEDIDITLAEIMAGCGDPEGCLVDLTATYSIPDKQGGTLSSSGTVTIEYVPEPSTALMGLLGLGLSMAGLRRRK